MKTYALKVTPSTLMWWREDERASWEDHGEPADHIYQWLGRFKTKVEFAESELDAAIASAENFAYWWDDRPAYRAALARVASRLRELR